LDKYIVKLLSKAYFDLDNIYTYVSEFLLEPETAQKLIDSLEEVIFSLEQLPKRGSLRKTGVYAGKGYRQLFFKNFTIVYRINEEQKQVLIITVRYSKSQF